MHMLHLNHFHSICSIINFSLVGIIVLLAVTIGVLTAVGGARLVSHVCIDLPLVELI